jgi:Putative zinc-RING and/or ribbon
MSSSADGSHLLDGELNHRSYWTKKWRPRYFAVDGPTLSFFESEAIANAPGQPAPPLGSLHLSDRLAVLVIDEADDLTKGDVWGGEPGDGAAFEDPLLPVKDRAAAIASLSVKQHAQATTTRNMILLRGKNLKAKPSPATSAATTAAPVDSSVVSPTTHSRSSITETTQALLSPSEVSGTATPSSAATNTSSSPALPSSSTGLSYAALRCAGGLLTASYSDASAPATSPSATTGPSTSGAGAIVASGSSKKQHILVIAHLPKATAGAGAALDTSIGSAASSSSPAASSSSAVNGSGAGLKEPLILAADSRRELQLWIYVLRSRTLGKALPPHIVSVLQSRNESKAMNRRKLGLLERPFVVPITVTVPTPAPASATLKNEQEGQHSPVPEVAAASEPQPAEVAIAGNGIPLDHPDRVAMTAAICSYLKQRAESASASSSSGPLGSSNNSASSEREKAAKLKHLERVLAPRVEHQLYSYACQPLTQASLAPGGEHHSMYGASSKDKQQLEIAHGAVHFDRESYNDKSTLRQRIRRAFADHRAAGTAATAATAASSSAATTSNLPSLKEDEVPSRKGTKRSSKGGASDDGGEDNGSVVTSLTESTVGRAGAAAVPPPPPLQRPKPSPPPVPPATVAEPPQRVSPEKDHYSHRFDQQQRRPPSGSVAYSVGSISTNAMNGMKMVTRQRYGGSDVPGHPWTSEDSPYYLGPTFVLKHYPPPDYDWVPIAVDQAHGIPVQDTSLIPSIARQSSDASVAAGAVATAKITMAEAEEEANRKTKLRSGSSASSSSSASSASSSQQQQQSGGSGSGAAKKEATHQPRGDGPLPSTTSESRSRSGSTATGGNGSAMGGGGGGFYPISGMTVGASTASMRMTLVLDRRPAHPPPLPVLNKWQHRRCASCGVTQSTGMWGVHANYCFFTELLFCSGKPKTQFGDSSSLFGSVLNSISASGAASGTCMASEPRPIPWRVVQDLDATPLPVSKAAAVFIDRMWHLPLVALSAVAPGTLARVPALQRVIQLRARIADLIESAVVTAGGTNVAASSHSGSNAVRSPSPGPGIPTSSSSSDPALIGALSPPSPSLGGSAGPSGAVKHLYRPSYYTRPGGILPSEEPTPIDDAARRSKEAAAMKDRLLAIGRVHVGSSLGFMLNSVELLPLSLIVPLATSKSAAAKVLGRLSAAAQAIEKAVDDAATQSIQQAFALAAGGGVTGAGGVAVLSGASLGSSHPSPSASAMAPPPVLPVFGNPSPSAGGVVPPSVHGAATRSISINNSNNQAAAVGNAYGRGPQLTTNLNGAFGTAIGASPTFYPQGSLQASLPQAMLPQGMGLPASLAGQQAPSVLAGSLPKRGSLHTHSLPVGALPGGGHGPSPAPPPPSAAVVGAGHPHPYLRTATGNFLGHPQQGMPQQQQQQQGHFVGVQPPVLRGSVPALVGVHSSLLDEGEGNNGAGNDLGAPSGFFAQEDEDEAAILGSVAYHR